MSEEVLKSLMEIVQTMLDNYDIPHDKGTRLINALATEIDARARKNLCDTCIYGCIAACPDTGDLQFGDNADVIDCACYINRAALEKYRQPPEGDHDAAIDVLKDDLGNLSYGDDSVASSYPQNEDDAYSLAIACLRYCKEVRK